MTGVRKSWRGGQATRADETPAAAPRTAKVRIQAIPTHGAERFDPSNPARRRANSSRDEMTVKYPGLPTVIHGNGAVAEVMSRVCGGVIGYPITPSTEISEIYEAFRSNGGLNVWGKHPFFFEPEGEHSAQSGALGAALTGGKFVSNASSSQGILYGMESHYVTVGKKVGGFVLQVAARVVSKHSLNVMAGHDDVYALLASGYTILFGSNAQEAADLAAISYRLSSLSLIPVANAMDGFATSHMMTEANMPEPELLREFLGDPAGRIKSPTVAQDMLFGAKGRVFQLRQYLTRRAPDFADGAIAKLRAFLDANEEAIEHDNAGALIDKSLDYVPEELRGQWRRQWLNAFEKGTRQLVPALVDVHNPGLTGGVQNQPDFQAGSVDHRTHFVSEVPHIAREAMAEYSKLTGRPYAPILTYMCDDAETVLLGLGSVTDDAQAVATYLRSQGKKVGVISIKLLQPFPEAEVVAALKGKKSVTVLERSEVTALTSLVTQALFKARENAEGAAASRHSGAARIAQGHHRDLRPRRARPAAAPSRRRVQEHGGEERPVRLPRIAVLLQERQPARGGAADAVEGGLSRNRVHGARIRAEPEPAAEGRLPHPLPLGRRLRHHRHRQAAHRHSRRRARPAFEGGAEVRLGEERRADQLLHHAQPRSGAADQRRPRGRRNRRLARPQGVQPQQPAARPGRGRHVHPAVEPAAARGVEGAAGASAQDDPRQEDQLLRPRRFRRRQAARAAARARDPHDGHRLHRRDLRQLRSGDRRRAAGSGAEEDPPADRQEVRRQGRRGGRRQHGGDPGRSRRDPARRLRPA